MNTPRSFASLMEIYETNYIALRRLCPNLPRQGEQWVTQPDGLPPLYLSLLEHTRYTSSLELTHQFSGFPEESAHIPSLCVRIYYDARQAEVLFWDKPEMKGCCAFANNGQQDGLRIRWSANRFLNRWLQYCLGQGYAF